MIKYIHCIVVNSKFDSVQTFTRRSVKLMKFSLMSDKKINWNQPNMIILDMYNVYVYKIYSLQNESGGFLWLRKSENKMQLSIDLELKLELDHRNQQFFGVIKYDLRQE